MKKSILAIAALTAVMTVSARSLNVNSGSVSYSFPEESTGEMQYTDGTTLTVCGRTFEIADISEIRVDDTSVADNYVYVNYDGATASVTIAGNIAPYVTATVSGADVVITQSDETGDDTCGEISYRLQGASDNGSFTLYGNYKASVELAGLTLTSQSGAPIDIQDGKRINMRVAEGTVNTLVDAASGSQKGALSCKGHLEFKQKGELHVTGNKSHAIYAKEYITIKNSKITVHSAVKDGVNCNQYFTMESGSLTIEGSGDDGVQCAFKDATNREAEDTGTITIQGGTVTINTSATAAKCLKADGDFVMSGGSFTGVTTGGGMWDSTKLKTKASSCIGADGTVTITGGTLDLTSRGGGGKGISCDGDMTIDDCQMTINTHGGMFAYSGGNENQNYTGNADNLNSDYKSSPKGIKCDGNLTINGGTFAITTRGNGGEGLEAKSTLTINGGDLKIRAYDDGTNSSSHTYINGGNLDIITLKGDGVDANGAIYVSGGYMRIFGAASPEQGFDAGDGYTIYITGGTILSVGGGNSAPTNSSQSTQAYVILSQTVTANTQVSISLGDETLATFDIPADYGKTVWAAPGGGGGTTSGKSCLISTPELISGTTYTIKSGTSSTTSAARLTGGSTGPGGGGRP